jgi:hypothetical protein
MGDSDPSVTVIESVWMSDDRITVTATVREVASGDVIIWSFYLITSYYACVIWNIQTVICHEKVVISVLVYDFRSLTALPA